MIGRAQINGLAARSSTPATVNWTTPPGAGTYMIYAVIETGAAQVAQVRSDNDAAYSPLMIGVGSGSPGANQLYLPQLFR
ncbi:MAG: hypothetical protein HC822_00880 [Oscillochloris sp.]|nr:hypothetical protein [Oscillochloris sp.]